MTRIPMAQGDLLLLLPLAWQQYLDRQPAFAAYKKKYTPALATGALARLKTAAELPDEQARTATAEVLRGELTEQATEFLDLWNLLDGYIEEAYPGAVAYKAMREAAGHKHYEAAAGHDWSALEKLMKAALTFVQTNAETLANVGEMPDDFAGSLAKEVEDVRGLTQRFTAAKGTAQQGTTAQETALLACLAEFRGVSADAQRIFRRQPELARLFQQEYLLGLVRGTGQAGVRGTLTLADGRPAPGVAVSIGAAATTSDEAGRYALPVAAGSYTLVLGGAEYVRQEVPVVVEAGVKKRVDGVLGKMTE